MDDKKILVIEDDARISAIIQTIFKLNKVNADFAASGEGGVEMSKQNDYALILSDIMLPGMDGYEVLIEIKADARTSSIPFVFLSAFADDDDVVKGMRAGADDYLTKPFTAKTLLSIVRMYTE